MKLQPTFMTNSNHWSSGYASFDYEIADYQPAKLVKMDILLNGKAVDALSSIVHIDKAYYIGSEMSEKLKAVIPRQLYDSHHPSGHWR